MKRRCKDSVFLKKINLKGFKLTFRSKYRAADIETKKNSMVPGEIGRAHVWTPVTAQTRMPYSSWKKKKTITKTKSKIAKKTKSKITKKKILIKKEK